MTEIDMQEQPPRFFFHLIVVEIVYALGEETMLKKVQFFAKSDTPHFPARRLNQIQNTAALQVRDAASDTGKDFQAIEATILAMHPLGMMTDEEFYGPQEAVQGDPEEDSNVTPLKPN